MTDGNLKQARHRSKARQVVQVEVVTGVESKPYLGCLFRRAIKGCEYPVEIALCGEGMCIGARVELDTVGAGLFRQGYLLGIRVHEQAHAHTPLAQLTRSEEHTSELQS